MSNVPYARTSRTSLAAAEAQTGAGVKTQRERILEYLRQQGREGATDEEIAGALDLSMNAVRPRRGKLVEDRLVQDSGQTRPTEAGHPATVWVLFHLPKRRVAGPRPEKTRDSGAVTLLGEHLGSVRKATFTTTKKDVKHDLYLHGLLSVAEALEGRGAWVFDLEVMEALHRKGVTHVEVPTHQNMRFRVKLETLLGPHGFDITTGERPRVALELKHWTRIEG